MNRDDLKTTLSSIEKQQENLARMLTDQNSEIFKLREELYRAPVSPATPTSADTKTPSITPVKPTSCHLENVTQPSQISPSHPAAKAILKQAVPQNKTETKSNTAIPKPPMPTMQNELGNAELNFGKTWFVRLGIVSLVTGLVFLSNYAYQNYIFSWGAAPRVICLYLFAFILTCIGTYFEKAKASLKNYGRVLAAGGLATFYYTSYAAHHVDRLRIIDSPILASFVLVGAAGLCLYYSLWKKSNITAICSIALAYYSTTISPIGQFTLISSLVLTASGIYLLYKLRSAAVGFTTMLGGYLSFAYWQLTMQSASEYAHANWFLLGYWILSTAVILIPRSTILKEANLRLFSFLNNALFFLLFSINFRSLEWSTPLHPTAAIFGSSLILISFYMSWRKSFSSVLVQTYLGKGLALITLALCLWLSGPSLAISLTVQALLLTTLGTVRKSNLTLVAGILALTLSFIVYFETILSASIPAHACITALYFAVSVVLGIRFIETRSAELPLSTIPALMGMLASCFFVHSLPCANGLKIIILLTLCLVFQSGWLSTQKRFLTLRGLAHASHLLILGCGYFFSDAQHLGSMFWFTATALLIGITVIHVRSVTLNRGSYTYMPYIILATLAALNSFESLPFPYIGIIGMCSIGITLHKLSNRFNLKPVLIISLASYLYPALLIFGHTFFSNISHAPLLIISLAPMIHYALMRCNALSSSAPSAGYLVSLSMFLFSSWLLTSVSHPAICIALTGLTLLFFEKKDQHSILSITAYWMYALAAIIGIEMWVPATEAYLISLIPLAAYFIARFNPQRPHNTIVKNVLALSAVLTVWITCSLHISSSFSGSGMSICWAALGFVFLILGMSLEEKVFRAAAFFVLGCCVIRVYGVDVWKLHTVLRILSFITLGIVLLLAGYFYSKTADNKS